MRAMLLFVLLIVALVSMSAAPAAKPTLAPASLVLDVGEAKKLELRGAGADAKWETSDPQLAAVYSNGWLIALKPGDVVVNAGGASSKVRVVDSADRLVNPATIQQYPDNRTFKVGERKCIGTFLNGHMVGNEQKPKVDRNRVLNPRPLRDDKPLEWELKEGTPVFDGAGVQMGTAAPALEVNGRKLTSTKFNYGFSKVINGKLCLYGFTVDIRPDPAVQKIMDESHKSKSIVATSAWVPIDGVVEKELLLDNVGLGKGKLPRLPLQPQRYKITGGNPDLYNTPAGELRIVDDPDADPKAVDYIRRPTGTVNIIYCVPGLGLGGQSLDSVLITSNAIFRPARGVRVFVQPTFYPAGHPKAGQKSPKTETFIYGAVEVAGSETIYGWVAKEAMVAMP